MYPCLEVLGQRRPATRPGRITITIRRESKAFREIANIGFFVGLVLCIYLLATDKWLVLVSLLWLPKTISSLVKLIRYLRLREDAILIDYLTSRLTRNGKSVGSIGDVHRAVLVKIVGGKYTPRVVGYNLYLEFVDKTRLWVDRLEELTTPTACDEFLQFAAALAGFGGWRLDILDS